MKALRYFENLVKNLIEAPFERLFKPKFHPAKLRLKLLETMEAEQAYNTSELSIAPNTYRIMLNEADYKALRQRPAFERELLNIKRDMANMALEANIDLSGPISLTIIPRPNLDPGTILIVSTVYQAPTPPATPRGNTKRLSEPNLNKPETTLESE